LRTTDREEGIQATKMSDSKEKRAKWMSQILLHRALGKQYHVNIFTLIYLTYKPTYYNINWLTGQLTD
jgi:hypothetical protein